MDPKKQFKYSRPDLDSTQKYKEIIIHTTNNIWQHLEKVTDSIPEDCSWDELDEEQHEIILNTIAVEQEWILDPADHKEASMFTFDEVEG